MNDSDDTWDTQARLRRLLDRLDRGGGVWVHGPSGESGPLGKVLRSIARVYLDKPQSLVDIPGSPVA